MGRALHSFCMTYTTMEGAVRGVEAISRNITLPLEVKAYKATVTAHVTGTSDESLTVITEADKLAHTIPRFIV